MLRRSEKSIRWVFPKVNTSNVCVLVVMAELMIASSIGKLTKRTVSSSSVSDMLERLAPLQSSRSSQISTEWVAPGQPDTHTHSHKWKEEHCEIRTNTFLVCYRWCIRTVSVVLVLWRTAKWVWAAVSRLRLLRADWRSLLLAVLGKEQDTPKNMNKYLLKTHLLWPKKLDK